MAEEVISTIRTARAFGTQKTLSDIYTKHIENARTSEAKAAIWNGGGMAVFYFLIYGVYSLAFYFGTTLINEGHGEFVHVWFNFFKFWPFPVFLTLCSCSFSRCGGERYFGNFDRLAV